jgi:hypothetical protein
MRVPASPVFALVIGLTALRGADEAPKPVKVLRNYHDVLGVIPREMNVDDARNWSQTEKDMANLFLQRKLVDEKHPVAFRIRAEPIEAWPGLTVWCPLPSEEGYPIRMFLGKFKNEAQYGKIAALRPGDHVLVEGVMDCAKFEYLWSSASLSICLREGVITKVGRDGKPLPPLPKADLSIVSAVYGSGDRLCDVTDRVKAILDEPGAQFTAKSYWLGQDPNADGTKSLIIVYQTAGKRQVFSCREGGVVDAQLLLTKKE